VLRVLTWNLFHGRSQPPAGSALTGEFARTLAAWEWDVALLQEVPPWWPAQLARRADATQRTALTSRNGALPLRRALAERWPELMKSNGGGANALLARGELAGHQAIRLRRWPERRVAQIARLGGGELVVNYHASARVELAREELRRLWELALDRAAGAPIVLGGDLNLRDPPVPLREVVHAASRDVDHLFALGLRAPESAQRLERRIELGSREVLLSDHVPLRVGLARGGA
jgi:endonuclease/exonuclease/phosphatase family metal-dependent hydrolase